MNLLQARKYYTSGCGSLKEKAVLSYPVWMLEGYKSIATVYHCLGVLASSNEDASTQDYIDTLVKFEKSNDVDKLKLIIKALNYGVKSRRRYFIVEYHNKVFRVDSSCNPTPMESVFSFASEGIANHFVTYFGDYYKKAIKHLLTI